MNNIIIPPLRNMMAHGYEFRPAFRQMILSGEKRQTFRPLRLGQSSPLVGERIVGWVDKANGKADLILDEEITLVQKLHLDFTAPDPLWINNKTLNRDERESFALKDGFRNYRQLANFIISVYGMHAWDGVVIHWGKA